MGNLQLIGTPEGTVVTILESITKARGQGRPISQTLEMIEDHRKSTGHDFWQYHQIIDMSNKPSEQAADSLPMYVRYRVNLEHPGVMNDEQFMNAFVQAVHVLTN